MNISHESLGNLNAILTLVVEESDYKDKVEQELKNYRRNANMPGFRQGNVPMGMIKKMYEESLKANKVSEIVGDELEKYIKEKDLKLFGQPLPNKEKQEMLDFKNGKDFTLYYDIAFVPKVEVDLNEKRKIDFLKIEAKDEDVDKYLNEIRTKNGKRTNPENVQEGDVVFGEIQELDENNEIKKDGIENNTSIHVDFIKLKTVKEKFLKLKIEDTVDFNPKRSFKNDAELASLLGIKKDEAEEMKSDFRFTLKEVSRIETAEMNEELFSQIYPGAEIKSEEELIAKIREDIEKTYEAESNKFFFNQVSKLLVDETNMELPDEFLKRWIMEKNMDEEKQENKISPEQLEEQYPSYRDSLVWQIIEEKIAEDNDIKVTQDDIKIQVKKWLGAQMPGASDDEKSDEILNTVMESVMQNEDEVRKLSTQVMEDKMINLFKERFELNENSISYDDFVETANKFYQNK